MVAEQAGNLPNLKGRSDPILDSRDRMYLYTTSIAVDQGKHQPVRFGLKHTLRLTDVNGFEWEVRFIEIVARAALLEYQPPLS